jgi:hypothetical protein
MFREILDCKIYLGHSKAGNKTSGVTNENRGSSPQATALQDLFSGGQSMAVQEAANAMGSLSWPKHVLRIDIYSEG